MDDSININNKTNNKYNYILNKDIISNKLLL